MNKITHNRDGGIPSEPIRGTITAAHLSREKRSVQVPSADTDEKNRTILAEKMRRAMAGLPHREEDYPPY